MSTGRLAGKVALISGGARGMGAATARLFVAEGAHVVIGDILPEVKETAESIGEGAHAVTLDVTDEASWNDAVAQAEQRFGKLDVLVNNAGILMIKGIADTTEEDFRKVQDVNVLGVFLGIKAAAPAITRAGGGAIVNVSSVEGLGGNKWVIAYTASKFAVRGMSKAAALELARDGIRVNSVHPGGIDTPMVRAFAPKDEHVASVGKQVPMHRTGQPEEVAEGIAWLASDAASYVTGAELAIDGGATAGSGFKH